MINMLKNLVKKVDNVQELMDNLRRDGNYKKKVKCQKYFIRDQKFLQQVSQHSGHRRISEREARNHPN